MLRITPSRSGHPTLLWDTHSLHSSYDPVKEARRFIEETLVNKCADSIILLGPGLGYLVDAVRNHTPKARLICLYFSKDIFNLARDKPEASWHPDAAIDLPTFLDRHIKELDIEGLEVLEWIPSAQNIPEISTYVSRSLSQHIKEMRGNLITTSALGRLWIRNSILNFIGIDKVIKGRIFHPTAPTIIVASGPSVENLYPLLAEFSRGVNLWALPSAVPGLLSHNLRPDLIVMTDPGYYAVQHMMPARGMDIPLAMPLSAAQGSWRITEHVLLISQHTFYEEEILKRCGIKTLSIPTLGTVTASALELALKHCSGEIILCGLDFCYKDILSHARPNLFDSLMMIEANRLAPYYSRTYTRAADFAPLRQMERRTSLPLKTYAGWFSKRPLSKRVLRCSPTPLKIDGIEEIQIRTMKNRLRPYLNERFRKVPEIDRAYPLRKKRIELARHSVNQWIGTFRRGKKVIRDTGEVKYIFLNQELLTLSYFIRPADITILKRTFLSEEKNRASADALALLDKGIEFLADLLEKIQ